MIRFTKPHRHCERSEAIHLPPLDCFAPLAMTMGVGEAGHASASCNAEAKVATCSGQVVSVTATIRPFSRPASA